MSTIQLDWESPREEEWRRRLEKCGRSTAFQSWSWGAASAAVDGTGVRRAYILKNGRPVGLMQIFEERKLGSFTLGKLIRGPLFHQPVMPEDRLAAMVLASRDYPLKRLRRYSFLPELPDGPAAQGLMRQAGFHPAMAPYHTAWLDLTQPLTTIRAGMRQNFRNQLCRAERSGLAVRKVEDPRPLLARYDQHRKRRRYSGPSGTMLAAIREEDLLCLEAYSMSGDSVAGVLFVLHGRAATYQVGWTSAEGRKTHAHNLLLWNGLEALQESKLEHLDMGGIDWTRAPGVAHFKSGLPAEPFSLPGTFV
ncbi:GNAT family N-acetyltransferase [Pacificispira sp.]|uniref:GNAT family N-acetyltransferase n=1 Tax=Pacificispira sp. TaxID=2888761 RepID=UPI003B52985F